MITEELNFIIDQAVECAVTFGTGILTTVREEVEDYGYEWSDEIEEFVFEKYVEGQYES